MGGYNFQNDCEITAVSFGSACLTMCILYSCSETRSCRVPCSNTAALPKTRTRSDVFAWRAIVLFGWNEKCMLSDVACNSTFICQHVTDNPPIKWQGSAWVLYKFCFRAPILYLNASNVCILIDCIWITKRKHRIAKEFTWAVFTLSVHHC